MFCPECGKNISDSVKFCSECGAKIEKVNDTIFCEKCGYKFVSVFSPNGMLLRNVCKVCDENLSKNKCPICGTKIEGYKNKCDCCQSYWVDAKESSIIKNECKSNQEQDVNEIKCPRCGSAQITANKKGFGVGKALVGGVLLGGVGLLGGFVGSGKVKITCLKCGYYWTAGK